MSAATKILLVEDYIHTQIIIERLLKRNGLENVKIVKNGEEALHMVKEETFSLILMDMVMPKMDGFSTIPEIRKIPGYEKTPIIAVTVLAMLGDRQKCIDAGATDYISKPIISKEFINKVKYYTDVSVINEIIKGIEQIPNPDKAIITC